MNRKFDIITIALMVILCVMLVFVILNYFMKSEKVTSSKLDSQLVETQVKNNVSSGDNIIGVLEEIDAKSGDGIQNSGDYSKSEKETQTISKFEDNNPIIKSNGDISSKEKREVLQELDQTLMELFDVVDKVTIVDETRLLNEESGD